MIANTSENESLIFLIILFFLLKYQVLFFAFYTFFVIFLEPRAISFHFGWLRENEDDL